MRRISEIEQLHEIPEVSEYPAIPWNSPDVSQVDKYGRAFDARTQEEADAYLFLLIGHSLRFGGVPIIVDGRPALRRMTWAEACAKERSNLAWFALARDVNPERMVKIGEYPDYERACRLYGAFLPEACRPCRFSWEAQEEQIHADVAHDQKITGKQAEARVRRQRPAKRVGIVTQSLPEELQTEMF